MIENPAFVEFEQEHGLIFDQSDHEEYPLRYYCWARTRGLEYKEGCSYYGFVMAGAANIQFDEGHGQQLHRGQYWSTSESFNLVGNQECVMVIVEVEHTKGSYPATSYRAMSMVGGPIENHGRLRYIDGCTDSLLIPPVKLGDPCLNHLHFPPNIDQTPHTHPSHRIGIVARGRGTCVTPWGEIPLYPGQIFVIKEWDGETYERTPEGDMQPVGTHKFRTPENSGMDVIAFHPDSDFGPEDVDHPMINRTIVGGVPASEIDGIQTK